jgi:ribonuclease P protein component
MAFIASKKVGNAVKRSRAKRRIRALCVTYEKKIKTGKYIFVAKDNIFAQNPKDLEKDFKYAMKKLELFK